MACLLRQINDDSKDTLQQIRFSLQKGMSPAYVKWLLSSLFPKSRCKDVPKLVTGGSEHQFLERIANESQFMHCGMLSDGRMSISFGGLHLPKGA